MVCIGFLSRVCSFTWTFIQQSQKGISDPFPFKLYHGSLSLNEKGLMTPVLMVDVARSHIQCGLSFFQEFFDGELPYSPCSIPYLFFTLYQNQLSDDERECNVNDSISHTGQVSLIHLHDILDIDAMVRRKQNIAVHVQNLLLSLGTG